MSNVPLKGIRVLDLSPYLPSQYCSMLLSDLGAEVLLIEKTGPKKDAFPGLFELVNRGKKSLDLDLKSEQGRDAFYKLAEKSDVILEGFRPGVVSRLKIGYEDIQKIKHDIIYCSISGFGQDGPYRDRPGHDVNYLALGGYLSLPGQIGVSPSRPGIPLVDLCSSMFATVSVLSAILVKNENGKGQFIDVSMLDAITSWTSTRFGKYLIMGETITDDHIIATNDVFKTKDNKAVTLGIVIEEAFWRNFCEVIDRGDLLIDIRFSTHDSRMENREELSMILRDIFLGKTRDEWLDLFKNTDVPLTPVHTPEEVFSDPQILDRGLMKKIIDPIAGEINVLGFPVKFSDITTEIQPSIPRLARNTNKK